MKTRDCVLCYSVVMDKLKFVLDMISLEDAENSLALGYQHSHTSFELHYLVQGSCCLHCENQQRELKDGELVLLPPNLPHQFDKLSEDFYQFNLSFRILPPDKQCSDVQMMDIYDTFLRRELTILDLQEESYRELRSALQQMIEFLPRLNDGSFLHRTKLSALSLLVVMSIYEAFSVRSAYVSGEERIMESQNYQIDHFFNMNFNGKGTREELAKQLNVSPRHITRILHQEHGMSYRDKVNEKRLQTALYLISGSDKSFAEISELLGYSCPSNFNNFIKRKTGKTPTQLRKESKAKQ